MSELQDLVENSIPECRRLTTVATNPDESPETRLEAAKRFLDLAGMTARSARHFEHDLQEMTMPELYMALARKEAELAIRGAA